MTKKRYTVLLAYPEDLADVYAETHTSHVLAETPYDAIELAKKQCIKDAEAGEFGDPPGSDLSVVAVFEGWLEDVQPCTGGVPEAHE